MGKFYDEIPDYIYEWIPQQEIFWVASAPSGSSGHVNLSPKGMKDSFQLVSRRKCFYQDLTGSGIETVAHLKENGRITLMFCSFGELPKTVRLFGTGRVYERGTPEFDRMVPVEKRLPGARAVIEVDIYKVGKSCGFAVPIMTLDRPRPTLNYLLARYEKRDDEASCGRDPQGLKNFWALTAGESLDGLLGLEMAQRLADETKSTRWDHKLRRVLMKVKNSGDVTFVVGLLMGVTLMGGWGVVHDAMCIVALKSG
jgi:hypothetical protein